MASIELNWERIEENWKHYQESVRRRWAKLSREDVERIAGSRAALAAMIEKAYGVSHGLAQMQLESWQGQQEPAG